MAIKRRYTGSITYTTISLKTFGMFNASSSFFGIADNERFKNSTIQIKAATIKCIFSVVCHVNSNNNVVNAKMHSAIPAQTMPHTNPLNITFLKIYEKVLAISRVSEKYTITVNIATIMPRYAIKTYASCCILRKIKYDDALKTNNKISAKTLLLANNLTLSPNLSKMSVPSVQNKIPNPVVTAAFCKNSAVAPRGSTIIAYAAIKNSSIVKQNVTKNLFTAYPVL